MSLNDQANALQDEAEKQVPDPKPVTDDMRDKNTPESVRVTAVARKPETDPTLGVPIAPDQKKYHLRDDKPPNRLVTLGDSLTHGFQSGAIFNTDISYPMIIAWEMGWDRRFRHPNYPGYGGLPLNIEFVVRQLEHEFGDKLNWWEWGRALFVLRGLMDDIEDYWERGRGSLPPTGSAINHNLAVYGWDLRDTLSRTSNSCHQELSKPKDDVMSQLVEGANPRAAIRVLHSADGGNATPVQAAKLLGEQGAREGAGIETLIVLLGANNALGSVVQLQVKWSQAPGYQDLKQKQQYTVWAPDHFATELEELVRQVKQIRARHVIWGTVPHVTIVPIARGMGPGGSKPEPGSRYFPYYSRPWVEAVTFDKNEDPHITAQQARAIDSAIDQYNYQLTAAVKAAREEAYDWYLLDVAGMLDRLASRRYIEDPLAQPWWWTPYELPPLLQSLAVPVTSHFFASGPQGRTQGGLFTLDGVHPTTIGYGLLAQEFIHVMQRAGVKFYFGDDGQVERTGPVLVDFKRLLALDSLMSDPPRSFTNDLHLLGWLDQKTELFQRIFRYTF